MIALAILLASSIAAGAIIGAIAIEAGARLPLWPERTPHPYACHRCGVAYSDARALGWHLAGQHPDTYDGAHVSAVEA